jgi:3-oxoacyl-[acyl-carrier-protein] synthase-3
MAIRAVAVGCGAYLPSRIVTNDELSKALDLEMAGIEPNEIDLIICATSTATRIQARLGCTNGAAFDVQAVCSGFIYALSIADGYIRLGKAKTVLVVGAETFSRILDWDDRSTCVLFGDGAGALLLRAEPGNGNSADRGLLSTHIHSDGRYHDALYVDGGPSLTGTIGHLRMEGKEVFRHAVVRMAEAIADALEANGLSASDIDWLVPHQANLRIIDAMGRRFDLPKERVVVTVDRHANTSAASIPLALSEAVGDGRIKVGDLVVMEAMGGGFTWGSALLRW